MGNCCSRSSDAGEDGGAPRPAGSNSTNFAGPGRTLGSATAPTAKPVTSSTAPPQLPPIQTITQPQLPQQQTQPTQKADAHIVGGIGGFAPGSPDEQSRLREARSAAARAAEDRYSKGQTQPQGTLGKKLAAEKKQTRTNTLEAASKDERDAREADANAAVRNWD